MAAAVRLTRHADATVRRITRDDIDPALHRGLGVVSMMKFDSRIVRALVNAMLARSRGVRVEGVRTEILPHAACGIRLHLPQGKPAGALLWIHGGGYVIGNAVQDDRFAADTAKALGIVVVAASYRLAPAHPYPAPLDDCFAAWTWLLGDAARYGIERTRIAIGGQSAGGGLAAALVQRIHDGGGPQPLAQWLFCPMLDDRTAARRELDDLRHFVWNNRDNRFGWRSYLGAEPGGTHTPPYAVPARRAALAGLPPSWIGVGDVDLFLAEDAAYADRLRDAGVPVAFNTVPGAPHGFEAWANGSPVAKAYVAEARRWLGAVFGIDRPEPA